MGDEGKEEGGTSDEGEGGRKKKEKTRRNKKAEITLLKTYHTIDIES